MSQSESQSRSAGSKFSSFSVTSFEVKSWFPVMCCFYLYVLFTTFMLCVADGITASEVMPTEVSE